MGKDIPRKVRMGRLAGAHSHSTICAVAAGMLMDIERGDSLRGMAVGLILMLKASGGGPGSKMPPSTVEPVPRVRFFKKHKQCCNVRKSK